MSEASVRVLTVVSTQRVDGTDIWAAEADDGLVIGLLSKGTPLDMIAYLVHPTTIDRWAEVLLGAYQRGGAPGHAINTMFEEYGFGGTVKQISTILLGAPVEE